MGYSPFRPLILAKCQEIFDVVDSGRHLRSLNVHCCARNLHTAHDTLEQTLTSQVYGKSGLYHQRITEQSHSCDCPDRADICKHIIKLALEALVAHEDKSNDS